MKVVFRNYDKVVAIANITNQSVDQVENMFNLVFECYPDATFEYIKVDYGM